jgi:hypothetical protein
MVHLSKEAFVKALPRAILNAGISQILETTLGIEINPAIMWKLNLSTVGQLLELTAEGIEKTLEEEHYDGDKMVAIDNICTIQLNILKDPFGSIEELNDLNWNAESLYTGFLYWLGHTKEGRMLSAQVDEHRFDVGVRLSFLYQLWKDGTFGVGRKN